MQMPASTFLRTAALKCRKAFTLLEMLVVVGIIGILLVLTIPAVSGIVQSSRLSAAGDQVLSLFSTAQQIASAEGRTVELRFVKHKMQGGLYQSHYQTVLILRNYQPGEYLPDGEQVPFTGTAQPWSVLAAEPVKLPQGIVISDNAAIAASSLMTSTSPQLWYDPAGSTTQPLLKIYQGGTMAAWNFPNTTPDRYCSIYIRADGTSLPQLSSNNPLPLQWYVTLVDEKVEEQATSFADVHNFYTIQIDPINGHATFFRP